MAIGPQLFAITSIDDIIVQAENAYVAWWHWSGVEPVGWLGPAQHTWSGGPLDTHEGTQWRKIGLSTVHGPGLPDSRDSQYPKFWEYWESRSPDSRDSQNPQNVEAIGSLGSLDSRTPNTLKIWDIGSLGSLGVWTPKTLNISGFGSPGVQSVDHCLMVTVLRSMGNWHKYSEKVSGKTNFCCWECSLSLFYHLSQREGCP